MKFIQTIFSAVLFTCGSGATSINDARTNDKQTELELSHLLDEAEKLEIITDELTAANEEYEEMLRDQEKEMNLLDPYQRHCNTNHDCYKNDEGKVYECEDGRCVKWSAGVMGNSCTLVCNSQGMDCVDIKTKDSQELEERLTLAGVMDISKISDRYIPHNENPNDKYNPSANFINGRSGRLEWFLGGSSDGFNLLLHCESWEMGEARICACVN